MKTVTAAILTVTLLISVACGEGVDSATEKGRPSTPPDTGLHLAALMGNVDAIRQHVEAGSDLNEIDSFGSTPLVVAATFGRTEAARALLEAGADPEIRNQDGSAPLQIAAFLGHTKIVRTLLDAGADAHSRNMTGSTAFDIVSAPLDSDRDIYSQIGAALGPMGFAADYERVEAARPAIAEMLRPGAEDLDAVVYSPLPSDHWKVSTPAEQELDPRLVAELYLDASRLETLYGLLVVKNGHLVAESYFNGGAVDQEALLQSASKSFTSALVGIALDQDCLTSVDQKMMDFFPEYADQIVDPRKEQITIRDLLQMRAGYPWEESDPALWEALLSGDYLRRTVNFHLVADPGSQFNYSNLSSHFLGVIVARACDADLGAFAQEHLFSPIGAELGKWITDKDGYRIAGGEIHTTARDAAKFGQLYLNDGEYEGNQVVPADWVGESLQSYSPDVWVTHARLNRIGRYFRDLGYGYQWWSATVGGRRIDFAAGHGGQYIVLVHDLDMVIVVTGDPFYIVHTSESWKHEQANLNLVGKFIRSVPGE